MKAFASASVVSFFATFTLTAPGLAQTGPTLVTAPVEKVFVPLGFDDNDDIEVVIHGHFANSCFKTGPTKASVDEENHTVEIVAQAWRYNGGECAQMLVPFVQSVKIGTVKPATYKIVVADRPAAEVVPLVVATARTTSADDNLYAPVASVALDAADGQYTLRLEGEYPLMFVGCMVMKEVKTYMSPGNTLVVLPIAELTDGPACATPGWSMKYKLEQPLGAIADGEYLIHVRTLNGNSLNRFTELVQP